MTESYVKGRLNILGVTLGIPLIESSRHVNSDVYLALEYENNTYCVRVIDRMHGAKNTLSAPDTLRGTFNNINSMINLTQLISNRVESVSKKDNRSMFK